jgi:hypothetical protein
MIHPSCKKRGVHNWDNWQWAPSTNTGERIQVTPDGLYAGAAGGFLYRRECQNMGCDAVELAHALVPDGVSVTVDRGGSEVLYKKEG